MGQGYPDRVIMGECWARDGLQNEANVVPTEHKVEMLSRLVEAGFKKLEATSFAHPKYLPQFADAEAVLERIPRRPDVSYRAICTNMRAIERAVASKEAGYGVDEIAMVVSASEAHNQANLNKSTDETKRELEAMTEKALETGHEVLGWVLTSFGCPIGGDVPVEQALSVGRWWRDIGATYIGFGDTTGAANPRQAGDFYDQAWDAGFTDEQTVVHFHDTRGWGIANSLVGVQKGYRLVDSSIGGIGGQPHTSAKAYHRGFTGNAVTEDLVMMLQEMGIETGIAWRQMLSAGRRAERIIGRRLRSQVVTAGPVPHQGIAWSKDEGIRDAEVFDA